MEDVPGVMARVNLPPDHKSACVTTIVDSRNGDLALEQGLAGNVAEPSLIGNIDSIVLVYDLSREETFTRLNNHWLPLIENFYHGKVGEILDVVHHHLTVVWADPCHRRRSQDGSI